MFIMKNKTKGEKDISISIVNYNSTNYLIDCIKSIRKYSERLDIEILITDNASLDFKPSAIHEIFPDATISCNFAGSVTCDNGFRALILTSRQTTDIIAAVD